MSERITIFDIEILNMDPASICSIGIVVLEDLKIVDTYYSLIKPRNLSFDKYRYNIHHIRNKDLYKEKNFKKIWAEIHQYFENTIVISHDIQTDMASLRAALKKNHIEYPTLKMSCTNVLAHLFEPNLTKYSVIDLCDYFNIKIENPHHALDDALACSQIFIKLMEKAGYQSIVELHHHYHIAFGEMKSNYYRNIISPEHASIQVFKANPLSNMSFAFTGNLKLTKETLQDQLDHLHAFYTREVNTHTDYLVIGSLGFTKVRYGGENKKVNKAKKLMRQGQDLKIIHENDYLQMIKSLSVRS